MKKLYFILLIIFINQVLAQVTVSGRKIRVNGSDYDIKGVCYSPHAIGAPEWTPDWSKVSQDISMMKAACVNTIRTYRPIADKGVLDAFANNGIKIIIGFTLDETRNGTYANYINTYKNHPAILMWVFGNEFNYHPDWFGNNMYNWYGLLNQVAGNARSLDPNHPVATVHGELPPQEAINACPNVQVWGMNIYRIDNPGSLYSDWAARSGKPMFIGESGADSYPDRNAPATALTRIYNTVKANTATCAGICFFEWVDEWWKSGNNGAQDTGGFPNGGVPYDGFANEEHWGIVDIYRNAKPAYTALKSSFCTSTPTGNIIVYKDCNYGGYAIGLNVGDYNYGALYARGVANEDISSIKVSSGYEVVLYENDNFTGATLTVSGDNSCLVGNGWNDRTTSLKVRTRSAFSVTIQAENYNAMLGVQKENTSDVGGGQNVGYIDGGDWMAYNSVNFPQSGSYKIECRVASPSGATLSLDLNAGSIQLGTIGIPATGGWQNWTTVSKTVNVNAGTYNLGVFATTGGWNFNWIKITKVNNVRSTDEEELVMNDAAESAFEIFPSPVSSELNISSMYGLDGGSISIVSTMGMLVIQSEASEKIDVSSLTPGVYTLVFTKDGNTTIRRFMKI